MGIYILRMGLKMPSDIHINKLHQLIANYFYIARNLFKMQLITH